MAKKKQLKGSVVVASVDAGNGGVNAIVDGQHIYFPSVRARTSGQTLGLGADMESNIDWFEFESARYMAGDDVLITLPRYVDRHQGTNRYGHELQRSLVALALARAGVGEKVPQEVDLTLFAPPGLFSGLSRQIKDRFKEAGDVEIRLKGYDRPHRFSYASITVLPEGFAAVLALAFDKHGQVTKNKSLAGRVLVVDSGMFTTDVLMVTSGMVDAERLDFATWTDGGIDPHVRQKVLKEVRSQSRDLAVATLDHVDAAFRDPKHILRVGTYETDITPLMDVLAEDYANWIANNIVDSHFNSGDGFSGILLVGGGAALIQPIMSRPDWFGAKIISTGKTHPADMNAQGGYNFRMAKLAGGKPR